MRNTRKQSEGVVGGGVVREGQREKRGIDKRKGIEARQTLVGTAWDEAGDWQKMPRSARRMRAQRRAGTTR